MSRAHGKRRAAAGKLKRMSKKKSLPKADSTLDRSTPQRTIVNMRQTITNRLKQLGRSRLWLSEQVGVRSATVYDFLAGRAAAKAQTVEKMLSVLGLEIRPKE